MKFKTAPLRDLKAAAGDQGQFEAIVAVFGNVDHAGDRIIKGAFINSLAKWKASGRPIPIIFSHLWQNLDAHIGEVVEAKEMSEGLWVRGQLDMDDPPAAKVFRMMKRGTVAEFSFAYDIVRERVANGANELLELDVIEVGPTLKGMNPATQLLATKGAQIEDATGRLGSGRKQAVAGSFEERRELVSAAVRGRYGDSDRYWAYVVATYPDRVIVAIHSEDGASYREIAYTLKDGSVVLGDERDVALETTIVPKGMTDPVRASFEVMGLTFRTPAKGRSPRNSHLRAQLDALGDFGEKRTTAAQAAAELLAAGWK